MIEISSIDPGGLCCVVRRLQSASRWLAEIVNQNVVILKFPSSVGQNPFNNFYPLDHLHIQTHLFADFAANPLFQCFPELQDSTGDRPVSFLRRPTAADEQDSVAMGNDRANAHDRPRRIVPRHVFRLEHTDPQPATWRPNVRLS